MTDLHKATSLFLFSLICLSSASQLRPVYDFQKDDSILKRKYYQNALENKSDLIKSLGSENKKDYTEIYEARFKEVAELLQSTRSVTDHVANNYLQAILQKIIAVNPELRDKNIRLIFSRDWWPNAYSMGEGTLAVNAGLMVFLNNEAELVFVICHELSHFYLDHSNKTIRKNVEMANSAAFKSELKRLSKQEYGAGKQLDELIKKLAFGSRQHSRENESEADMMAFRFMKKTGFDCGGMISCLQLLDKVDDSLVYKPINIEQAFNFSGYPFKKKWIEKESSIFSAMKEDDSPLTKKEKDSLKTHPDCSVRISKLNDSIRSVAEGKKFMVDETLFRKLKKDFFIELTEQQFKAKNLDRNLYYSLQILQSGENTPFAVYSIARCLNNIYDNQKNHKLGIVTDKEARGYPDDYNLLLRLLDRLRLDEIANMNYNFCSQYKGQMSLYAGFEEEWNKAVKQKAQY